MRILYMSAGNRGIWFNKNNPLATFVDIRPEVVPDIVADTRSIPEDVGTDFDLIVFDPPHVNFGRGANMSKDYGHHTASEIRDIVCRSAIEAHRVSRENALMAFKWNDHDQKLERILDLMSKWWVPLFGHRVAQKTKHSSSTYWVLLHRVSA